MSQVGCVLQMSTRFSQTKRRERAETIITYSTGKDQTGHLLTSITDECKIRGSRFSPEY